MADRNADLIRLLHEIDGQLGLAVHRGEGSRMEWKFEAAELINRIRGAIRELDRTSNKTAGSLDLPPDAPTPVAPSEPVTVNVFCNECGAPITMTEPDLSENGRICSACAVRISLGDKP